MSPTSPIRSPVPVWKRLTREERVRWLIAIIRHSEKVTPRHRERMWDLLTRCATEHDYKPSNRQTWTFNLVGCEAYGEGVRI